jgi:hypothetical protein
VRIFTGILVILFSFSIVIIASDNRPLFNKKQHKMSSVARQNAREKISSVEDVAFLQNRTSTNRALQVRKNTINSHVLIDSSKNGFGWMIPSIRAIDRFKGVDASGYEVDYLVTGYRQYITSLASSGVIGATTIDVANGLDGNQVYRHVELNKDLYDGTIGGRYPGVVALDRPFILFNQYISGDNTATPAISKPYAITDFGSYGPYGGLWTSAFQMDEGYSHHDCPTGNRLWSGSVAIEKAVNETYHFVGAYDNWFLDSEGIDNDIVILTASSTDPTSGWIVNPNAVTLDPDNVFLPRHSVSMNKNGFGAVAGPGHIGYLDPDSFYYYVKTEITYSAFENFGETWSEWDTLSFAELGFPMYHNPANGDSLLGGWEIQGADTVWVWYTGPTFMGTNFDMDVVVDNDNTVYIAFNAMWGRPSDTGWYPSGYYSGLFLAWKKYGEGWNISRIAYNNGIFEGDENPADISAYFFDTEVDLALDENNNIYAAWLDRRSRKVELAEKLRYSDPAGGYDPDYKTDIYASRSLDGGATWCDTINVTDTPSLDEYELKLARSADSKNDGTVYVAYCLVNPAEPIDPAAGELDNYTYRVNNIWVGEGNTFPKVDAIEKNKTTASPDKHSLAQNYPNPFNPTTNIGFTTAKSGKATLDVYSVTGQKIARLFNGLAQQGKTYQVIFDGTSLAAGIYFYKLNIGGSQEIRKMALIK